MKRKNKDFLSTGNDGADELLEKMCNELARGGNVEEIADKYVKCSTPEVTPGLTCLWQVSGRSNISFEGQMRLDNDYIKRNGKLSDDFSLILKTFKVVFKGDGAY